MATSQQVQLVIAVLSGAVQKERDALALEIVHQLSRQPPIGTPVATGWARAGWLPSLGQSATGDALVGKASAADASRAAARQQAAIASLLSQGAGRPTDSVFVSNDRPYIRKLNDGHSKQTAAGFFERCVEEAVKVRGTAQFSVRGV